MTSAENRNQRAEVPHQETISTLAILREKLQQLAADGKIHYLGDVGPDDVPQRSHLPKFEQVDIYIGLIDPLFPAMAGKSRQLMAKSEELARQIGIGSGGGHMKEGDVECGILAFREQIAERTPQPEVKLLVEDVSVAMQEELGLPVPIKKETVMRFVDVRVYEDKKTAELEYKLDKGIIERREYKRLKRKQRHPVRAELFNMLNPFSGEGK